MVLASVEITGQWAVGWGTLALLIAGVAQGKGRGGLNWFLLGFLGGPIALFFLLLADRKPG